MMPHYPNVAKWVHICSELMISAHSMQRDLDSNRIIDRKPAKDWLHGYNVFANGAVVNHHINNPAYMMCIVLVT